MATPHGTNDDTPDPLRHVYGYVEWKGWWLFPVVALLATTASVVAAVLVAGVGPDAAGFLPTGEAAAR
jgi:hypothetical protein